MTTAQDKRKQRDDLKAKGYSWEYLKDWQPRVTMWRHTPWLNNEGIVVQLAGTEVPNQPGNPDTQMRLSARGLLPWPPGADCLSRDTRDGMKGCKGCRERFGATAAEVAESLTAEVIETPAPEFDPPTSENTVNISDIDHTHRYRGKRLGAPCATVGCTATRQTVFKTRKQAAVTMAEAAG